MAVSSEAQSGRSPDWVRDWAERFLRGWNSHDPEQLLGLASDDVTWIDPLIPGGVAEGKSEVSAWLLSAWAAFPDLTFEIVGEPFISIDGARVALAWRGTATFTGPHRSGIEPTGARIEITGIDTYEFADDLLCRVVTETDTMPLLTQIGALPASSRRTT
jgi:predicted ester cyclase